MDAANDQMFIIFDDLKLIEVNLQSQSIVRQFSLAEVDDAAEQLKDAKAISFAMYREVGMFAVSTETCVFIFNYEDGLELIRTIEVPRVVQILFVDLYVVLVQESEDATEATLLSHQIDGDEPEGQITVKQFSGRKVMVRPSENSVYFAAGRQIGRV